LVFSIGLALLTIGGVLTPIWISTTSSARVERAIQDMENRFEKLAGIQLREPDIDAYICGQKLEDGTFTFAPDKTWTQTILFRNNGDGRASKIRIQLYIDDVENQIVVAENYVQIDDDSGRWYSLDFSDEEGFVKSFQIDYIYEFLNPKAHSSWGLRYGQRRERISKKFEYPRCLKFTTGNPSRREYPLQ